MSKMFLTQSDVLQVVPDSEDSDAGGGRGNSFLHLAAMHNCCTEFESHINKSSVNLVNADGETPLHLAAESGCTEDVESLLRAGTQCNLKTETGG